jgi:hypothetical protein
MIASAYTYPFLDPLSVLAIWHAHNLNWKRNDCTRLYMMQAGQVIVSSNSQLTLLVTQKFPILSCYLDKCGGRRR